MRALRDWRAVVVLAALAALLLGMAWLPPLPQSSAFHDFAVTRTRWGIPHFDDVVSNLGFLLVGLWGLVWLLRVHRHWPGRGPGRPFLTRVETWPYLVFFGALILVASGSAYYHWAPDHGRLYWDRLAMTIAFMSLFAAILSERLGTWLDPWFGMRFTALVLPLLILLGMAAATHWAWSEARGAGDLRLYLLSQAIPLGIGSLLILLYPSPYTRGGDLLAAAGWYLLALAAEQLDHEVFALTGGWLSGHTLKHLLAALAGYWVLRMLQRRMPRTLAASPRAYHW